jgi:nicotinate-nucleotide pyrophosphorylase (carboxylating)
MSPFDPPLFAVRELVTRALAEDLLPLGDLTAGLLDGAVVATAAIVSRQPGVLAGTLCATETYAQVDRSVAVQWLAVDGDDIGAGTEVAEVTGPVTSILTGERTALNLLCHLSGVATLTRRFVDAAGDGPTRVLDTRKTTPGMRAVEKAAVRAGGGHNHRGNLSEMVLVKDNHRAVLGITEAVTRSRKRWPLRTVEVECDTIAHVRESVEAGADAVLLDNMDPGQVALCVAEVAGRLRVEASGGITLATVGAYAAAGVDMVSVGALTASAPSLDLGLDLEA